MKSFVECAVLLLVLTIGFIGGLSVRSKSWMTTDGREIVYANGCVTIKGKDGGGDSTACGGNSGVAAGKPRLPATTCVFATGERCLDGVVK